MEIKDLIVDLAKTFEQFKADNDSRLKEIEAKGHADPLLTEKVDKINAEISKMAEMKRQIEALDTALGRRGMGGDFDSEKAEKAQAFNAFMRRGDVQAALSTLSDPDGGFLVPEEVENAVDRVAGTVSAMRRLASKITIGTDTYKKLVGQGGAGSGWVGEKDGRDATDTPTLAEIAINTKEVYANPAATQKVLDDARINIENWLAEEIAIAFSEKEGISFIRGNGVEQPKGILGYTTAANASYVWGKVGYIFTGSTSAITADSLFDVTAALKSVYRNGAAWLMNDATQNYIRKMKDGEGNYLWRPGLTEGAPNLLLGKPVEIDDNMDSIGSGKFPIALANFPRAYLIVDRAGIRVLRDPYTNKPYVHFYSTKRVGGGIANYEAIKLLKTHTS